VFVIIYKIDYMVWCMEYMEEEYRVERKQRRQAIIAVKYFCQSRKWLKRTLNGHPLLQSCMVNDIAKYVGADDIILNNMYYSITIGHRKPRSMMPKDADYDKDDGWIYKKKKV
jgi:hypothetical protein